MPLFAEQPDNVARAIDRGFGLAVSVQSKTLAKDMEHALKRVLHEPSFAASAARISHLVKARRWTPAETAASKTVPDSCVLQRACLQHASTLQPLRNQASPPELL